MSTGKKCLWEIFVPTMRNDGRPIRVRFHRVWDTKVREISGGLTVMPVAKGQWVDTSTSENKLFRERMIPVRIIATRAQMLTIIEMTKKYYEQIAVLAYKLSDDVILRHDDSDHNIG
jgi:hypothetical protein